FVLLVLLFTRVPQPSTLPFFFFYSSGHPRDLHSFPTRRSSDLQTPRAERRAPSGELVVARRGRGCVRPVRDSRRHPLANPAASQDRKSTRLNSSHDQISYAVFCLKKKKKT